MGGRSWKGSGLSTLSTLSFTSSGVYHRAGMKQGPGPRITNLQLLQLLFQKPNQMIQQCGILHNSKSYTVSIGKLPVKLRASKVQNKGGQQDVDV